MYYLLNRKLFSNCIGQWIILSHSIFKQSLGQFCLSTADSGQPPILFILIVTVFKLNVSYQQLLQYVTDHYIKAIIFSNCNSRSNKKFHFISNIKAFDDGRSYKGFVTRVYVWNWKNNSNIYNGKDVKVNIELSDNFWTQNKEYARVEK